MAKMQIAPRDRPRVKLECLVLLTTMKLDPARLKMISQFIDVYLPLTTNEMKEYESGMSKLNKAKQDPARDHAEVQASPNW